jgi:hypothetical protein
MENNYIPLASSSFTIALGKKQMLVLMSFILSYMYIVINIHVRRENSLKRLSGFMIIVCKRGGVYCNVTDQFF